jgi:hypothetical protein
MVSNAESLVLVAMTASLIAIGVPTVITILVGTAAWFFGSPKWIPLVALSLGAALLFVVVGEAASYFRWCVVLYTSALASAQWPTRLAVQWFSLLLLPKSWLVGSPFGLLIGGTWLLLSEDRRNSPEYRVFSRGGRPVPSPWARIRSFVARRCLAATVAGTITIGVEISSGRPVRISLDALRRHLIVLGRSGRGKTVTILRIAYESALQGLPVLFIDGKGDPDVRDGLKAIAQANGREFYCVDAMSPGESCAYDAFAHKSITSQKDMIVQLRDWSEPHYKGIASAHAQVVFKSMAYGGIYADLHSFSRHLSVNAMLGLARRGAGRKGTYESIKSEIVARRGTEKLAIESIDSEVASLTQSSFGEVFDIHAARRSGRKILQLREAREQSAIVYCGLPALTFPDAASRFASLLTSDLKASLPASRKQWLILFDEFSVFANPTTTLNLINMGRSWGASICISTQSCADLIATGSEAFLRQVIGSVNSYLVHELTDPADSDLIAGIFSTSTSVEFTAQIVNNQRTGSASSRAVHEFKIHPEYLKHLALGEVYYLNKDQPDDIVHAKILPAPL